MASATFGSDFRWLNEPNAVAFTKYRSLIAPSLVWLLFCGQLAEGASFGFAGLVLLFHVLLIIAVRLLGGIGNVFAACVVYLACQNVTISVVAKLLFNQDPERPLYAPILTMIVMCCGMLGFCLGGLVCRNIKMRCNRQIIAPLSPNELQCLGWVCLVLNLIRMTLLKGGGSLSWGNGFMNNLQIIGYLGVAASSAAAGIRTLGRSYISPLVILSALPLALDGVLGAGRQGMVQAFAVIAIAGFSFGMKLSPRRIAFCFFGIMFFHYVLSPYAWLARGPNGVRRVPFEIAVEHAENMFIRVLQNPESLKLQKDAIQKNDQRTNPTVIHVFDYYSGTENDLLERYSCLPTIDAMVDSVSHAKPWGMRSIAPAVQAIFPGFLRPEGLPNPLYANVASWRIRELQPNDHLTPLTICFIPDAFSAYGFAGALLIPAVIIVLLVRFYKPLFDPNFRHNVFACALLPTLCWQFGGGPIAHLLPTIFPGAYVCYGGCLLAKVISGKITGR